MFLAGFKFALGMMAAAFVVVGIFVGIGAMSDLVRYWRERRRRIKRGIEVATRQAVRRSGVLRHPGIWPKRANLRIVRYINDTDTCNRPHDADSDRMPQRLFCSADFRAASRRKLPAGVANPIQM